MILYNEISQRLFSKKKYFKINVIHASLDMTELTIYFTNGNSSKFRIVISMKNLQEWDRNKHSMVDDIPTPRFDWLFSSTEIKKKTVTLLLYSHIHSSRNIYI